MFYKKISFIVLLFCFCSLPVRAQNSEVELFHVAQEAFEDGFYDVSLRHLDQLLTKYPQSSRRVYALLIKGQCYFFQKDYIKAYEVFHDLVGAGVYQDAALYWLGETFLKGADYKQAKEKFSMLMKNYPDSEYVPRALYSSAWIAFQQKDWGNVQNYCKKIIANYDDHLLSEDAYYILADSFYQQRKYERAIHWFSALVENYSDSPRLPTVHYYLGESYYYSTNYRDAVVHYSQVVESSQNKSLLTLAHLGLAWSYVHLKEEKLAEENFLAAQKNDELSREKKKIEIALGLARLYTDQKKYTRASEIYQNVMGEDLKEHPRLLEVWMGQANLFYQMGEYNQSIRVYQKVTESVENKSLIEKALFGIGWSYFKMGDLQKAIDHFKQGGAQTNNRIVKVSSLVQVADAYHDSEQYQKAIDVYDQILKEFSDEEHYTDYVQFRLGVALLRSEKVESALLSFHSLENNFPDSEYLEKVPYFLSLCYFKKGVWEAVVEKVSLYLERDVPDAELAEVLFMRAVAKFNLKNYDDAVTDFTKILSLIHAPDTIERKSELFIAKSYYQRGDVQQALTKLRILYNKYSDFSDAQEALLLLTEHYKEKKDYSQALYYYKIFIDEFSESERLSEVYYNMGGIYQSLRKFPEAVDMFKKVQPNTPNALYGKSRMEIARIFSSIDDEKALESYEEILKTSPEYRRDVLVKMAKIYRESFSDTSKAMTSLKEALEADRDLSSTTDAQIRFLIADLHEGTNQLEEAIDTFLQIPYLHPKQKQLVVKSYLRAARLFERKEDWGKAKITYQKVIELEVDESKFARERIKRIDREYLNL